MITITPFQLISTDERGATCRISNSRTGEFIFGTRKAGTISGRHYHKGGEGKNPELYWLLSGKVSLLCRNLHTQAEAVYEAEGPVEIAFPPMIWHELTAHTDIVFLELNSLTQHQQDTFRLES